MDKRSIKRQMMVLKVVDSILFLLVLGVGVPAIFFTKYQLIAAVLTMIGFGIVTQVGTFCHHRIAALKVELDKLDRIERQRRR